MWISDHYYGTRRRIIGVIPYFFLNILQTELFSIIAFSEIICKGMCLSPIALGYSVVEATLLDTSIPRSVNEISYMRIATTINREANRSFFCLLLKGIHVFLTDSFYLFVRMRGFLVSVIVTALDQFDISGASCTYLSTPKSASE